MEKEQFVVAIEDLVDVNDDDRCREAQGTIVAAHALAWAEALAFAEAFVTGPG